MWRVWPPRWSALWAGKFQPGFLCCCHRAAVAMESVCAGDNSCIPPASRTLILSLESGGGKSVCREKEGGVACGRESIWAPTCVLTELREGGAMPLNREMHGGGGCPGQGGCKAGWSSHCIGQGWGARLRPPLWLLWFCCPLPSTATSYYCPKVTLSAAQELNTTDLTCAPNKWMNKHLMSGGCLCLQVLPSWLVLNILDFAQKTYLREGLPGLTIGPHQSPLLFLTALCSI